MEAKVQVRGTQKKINSSEGRHLHSSNRTSMGANNLQKTFIDITPSMIRIRRKVKNTSKIVGKISGAVVLKKLSNKRKTTNRRMIFIRLKQIRNKKNINRGHNQHLEVLQIVAQVINTRVDNTMKIVITTKVSNSHPTNRIKGLQKKKRLNRITTKIFTNSIMNKRKANSSQLVINIPKGMILRAISTNSSQIDSMKNLNLKLMKSMNLNKIVCFIN